VGEVRFYDNEDARRELAVEMFKRHVRRAGITTNYDADIEYMDRALLAFADEWAARDLAPASEAG
jgi:cytochrome c biogenesis protein ResB